MKRCLYGVSIALLTSTAAFGQPDNSEARSLIEKKLFADAIIQLRGTLQLYPRDAQSWFFLAQAYLGNEQSDSAELAGRKSIQYEDEDPASYALLSEALTRQKKFTEANQILRDGLKERKNHPLLLLQLGTLQYEMDSLDAALRTFTLAREVDGGSSAAYEGMGDVYAAQGVNPMAVSQYEKVIELDSTHVRVMRKLIDLHTRDRQWNEAVQWLQLLLSKDGDDRKSQFQIGEIYFRAKIWSRAYTALKPYVERYESDTTAVRMFTESAFNARRWTDAAEWAQKAYTLDPDFREAFRYRANALYYQKEFQASIEAFKTLQSNQRMEADDFRNLGRSHQQLDQLLPAAEAYVEAVKLDSSMTSLMNDAGTIYMRLKMWQQAANMFEMRYALDTSRAAKTTALINAATCYLVLEVPAPEKAIALLDKAVELTPDYVPSYTRMGTAYLQLKDYGQARKAFEKAIEMADTNVTRYNDELGMAYKNIGLTMMIDGTKRWGESVKWLKKALEFTPNDEATTLLTAQGLQNDNKTKEALEYYKKVLKINPKNKEALEGQRVLEELLKEE